jgi:hypothetical protein
MLRASLVVVILSCAVVGALNFYSVKQKITTLRAELAAQTTVAQKAEADLARTRVDLDKMAIALKVARTELDQVISDRQTAWANVAQQTTLARKRGEELAATQDNLKTSQQALSRYQATGMEPQQIMAAGKEIKCCHDELAVLRKEIEIMGTQLAAHSQSEDDPILLPSDLRGTVISADPKWRFLVLDVGASQGVRENGQLLLRRGDKLVGKAKISRVQQDRCVANVLSGWDFGAIQEGDVAIPATPRS